MNEVFQTLDWYCIHNYLYIIAITQKWQAKEANTFIFLGPSMQVMQVIRTLSFFSKTQADTHTHFCFSTVVFCLFFKQEEKEWGELVLTSHFPRASASLSFSSTCCGENTELKRKPQIKNTGEKVESSCPFKTLSVKTRVSSLCLQKLR